MYTPEEKALIFLDHADMLTYRMKSALTAHPKGLVYLLKNLEKEKDFLSTVLKEDAVRAFMDYYAQKSAFPAVLGALTKQGIACLTILSDGYPERLKNTPLPPLVLYLKGNAALLKEEAFAVIGSRRTLPWAKNYAEEFTKELSLHFPIATTFSIGANECVIRSALPQKRVIVVLPTLRSEAYTGVEMLSDVEKNGLIVCEYPPTTPPQKYMFSVTGRIIAGLSKSMLVVSGDKKSGTNIAACYAFEYGRDVFALPYSPNIKSGEGANELIKKGAYLADRIEDILEKYHLTKQKKELPAPTEAEKTVLAAFSDEEELHLEKIALKTGLPAYRLGALLTALEVKGYLVRMGGNSYTLVK